MIGFIIAIVLFMGSIVGAIDGYIDIDRTNPRYPHNYRWTIVSAYLAVFLLSGLVLIFLLLKYLYTTNGEIT